MFFLRRCPLRPLIFDIILVILFEHQKKKKNTNVLSDSFSFSLQQKQLPDVIWILSKTIIICTIFFLINLIHCEHLKSFFIKFQSLQLKCNWSSVNVFQRHLFHRGRNCFNKNCVDVQNQKSVKVQQIIL